ncbi:cation-translocating P-type ATPase [Solemya velum gill symbiont]|uniref:cation-translocating P-type ATPase n=1 Tax=Solemya velum gill symbiont TaxID=2340 RepID=UPI0009968069|nr:cation-translocating P-type ATPase [Solemya velum gill symbiont]OOZ70851.1 ATPase [Solemya velum gill symbiont]
MDTTPQNALFHTLSAEQVASLLEVDLRDGLSDQQVAQRSAIYGANELREKRRTTLAEKFIAQFKDAMILILLAAAVIAGAIGEISDTVVILIIVILNATIGLIQEYRAERAVDALKRMTEPEARIRRGGHLQSIPSTQLVPGDVVSIEAGNVVTADLRLFEVADCELDEAALTGESFTVTKQEEQLDDAELPVGDRSNMAFKDTNVTRGRALGVVVATGHQTELGKIADLLKTSGTVLTPLQHRLERFGGKLAVAILIIAAVVFFVMLLTAISLAVAAIPEALPAVVTISLAMGAQKMGKHNALMRRLPTVESLGSVTYICSDKTGTLTSNRMRVERIDADGTSINSLSEIDIGSEPWQWLGRLLALSTDVTLDEHDEPLGDPTEVALYFGALDGGIRKHDIETDFPRIAELAFDTSRRAMTTLHTIGDEVVAFTKGAPEAVIPCCTKQLHSTGDEAIDQQEILQQAEEMATEGYRVLALAMRRFPHLPDCITQECIETELVLLGLVGLIDPPRTEVPAAISACKTAGIKPVMITGDHPATASAIARRLDIASDIEVMTGSDIAALSEEEFADRVEEISVYARVSPEQKIAIVKALQKHGEFVAMTGDGVNDAPALKRATIGIGMGKKGTDVAREASDMVLLDDNFATIVHAVSEGRRIFDNIRKFIKYTMTSNAGEVWVLFLAPFIGLPLPLLPVQILWINLVTDGLPGLALSAEHREKGIMSRPPRRPEETIFSHGMWQHVVWVGLFIAALSLGAQAWAFHGGSDNWQTIVFTVLTFSQLMHVLAIRSEQESLFSIGLFSNPALIGAILLTVSLQMMIIYVPFFNEIFHTSPLSAHDLLLCMLLPLVVFVAVEMEKYAVRQGWIYN